MSTGDVALLDALYDPASTMLLAFEKERAGFYSHGLSARWGNSPVLSYTASVKLLDVALVGSVATARLVETAGIQWIPQPLQLPSDAQAERRQHPEKYRPTIPRGPRGEITGLLAHRHEVTLVNGTSGWRLTKDAYDERHIYQASPDLVPGSWAEVKGGGGPKDYTSQPALAASELAEPEVRAFSTHYDRGLAVQCAANNWNVYNPQFCSFINCGGDCANFVSQCFVSGGQTRQYPWDVYSGVCGNGHCQTYSATYAGYDTWANN